MRKFILLAAGVVLSVGTLTACLGGPPPQPTDPHDVLVVGDSVSFSLGCVLGDGHNNPGCPARPGYTTVNEFTGACTIAPGTLSLYNGGTAGAPNCDTQPDQFGLTWQQAAAQYVPKVVVINTAGWEIVDRWENFVAVPDYQWGGATNGPSNDPYHTAAAYYSSELFNAINMFRSYGAKVVVALSPYISPRQPEPPAGAVPPGLECSWWEPEPFNGNPPTAQGDPNNPLTCPGQWRSPTGNTTYRSSDTKINQLINIVNFVKSNYFGGDPNVLTFNFAKHFNPGGAYNDYVCPPPHDSDTVPQLLPDLDPSSPTFGQMVMQCAVGSDPTKYPKAVLARAVDHSHLSSDGQFQILQPYLESCVKSQLGIGGNSADCS